MNIYQIVFEIAMLLAVMGLVFWNLRLRKSIDYAKKVCVDYFTLEITKAKEDAAAEAAHMVHELEVNQTNVLCERFGLFENSFKKMESDVDNLKKGVIPDYEEACAAVRSVNDFNRGLSAIMNFDPMEAARRMREEKSGKGNVNAE